MNKIRIASSILTVLLGAFLVVYGGYDDSPGAQMLGLVVVILSIVRILRSKKKNSA